MANTGKKLTDWHDDEVVHLHNDVLDADLQPSDKIMMAVLRKQAFTTGRITLHYPKLAGLARMPLSTVKNKGGIMDRLRKKGWIRGAVKDGACITVRMSPNWKSKSGEPSDFDVSPGTEPTPPDPEKGSTEPVPVDTETVPGAVLIRYQGGTETVPPSKNKKGVKGIQNKDESEAPVALTGSGSTEPGAPLNLKEETETANAAHPLTPALAGALRAEAEAWTEQVAEYIGRDRKVAWGVDVCLRQPDGNPHVHMTKNEPVGSRPWPGDVVAVHKYAAAWYPGVDPVIAFRTVIRACARHKVTRQHIFGHALRMQASQGYERPQIKLCSLVRLDNTGVDVPASVRTIGGVEVGEGCLLERAHKIAYTDPAVTCNCAPDPRAEAEIRRKLDPAGLYSAPFWGGCWKEASARYVAADVPLWAYSAYVEADYEDLRTFEYHPRLWIMDSIDPQQLRDLYEEWMECGLDFCDNWGDCKQDTLTSPPWLLDFYDANKGEIVMPPHLSQRIEDADSETDAIAQALQPQCKVSE